jgi:hypothetical protein
MAQWAQTVANRSMMSTKDMFSGESGYLRPGFAPQYCAVTIRVVLSPSNTDAVTAPENGFE